MSVSNGTAAAPPKLGLGGTTINAMALIAPGAFLWTTFALQAQAKAGSASAMSSMWFGLLLAVGICFLTALAYSELAKLFPGAGSSYLFAEQAFLNKEAARPLARVAKFVVGWASHLYYWIYPAVMVAMMGSLVGYIVGSLFKVWDPTAPPSWFMAGVAVVFTIVVTLICGRGVQGSTMVNVGINVIQIVSLIAVSAMFLVFRARHPELQFLHSSAVSVVSPHGLSAVMAQAMIAILLLVGFESVTSLGDEVHNPKRTIPLAVLLSLAIQGLFCYLLEYFAANMVINSGPGGLKYATADASGSAAPIGDMLKIVGSDLFHSPSAGFILMIIVACTVFIALVGTTISCMNTGARVTYAMGRDEDSPIPSNLGIVHSKTLTPYKSLWTLAIITLFVGAYGAWFSLYGSAVTNPTTAAQKAMAAIPNSLLVITYLSNFGTFALYGMTCVVTIMAFWKAEGSNVLKHVIVPLCGAVLNFVLMYEYIFMGAEAKDAFYIAVAFAVVGLAFLFAWSKAKGVSLFHPKEAALA